MLWNFSSPTRGIIQQVFGRRAQRWVIHTFYECLTLYVLSLLHRQRSLRQASSIDERNHSTRTSDYYQHVDTLICHPLHPKERREGAAECTRKWLVEELRPSDQRDSSCETRCSGHYRLWTCWAYCCNLSCPCKPRARHVRRLYGQRFRCWWPTYYDHRRCEAFDMMQVYPCTDAVVVPLVENYPGFPDGVRGPEMMDKFRSQSVKFGTTIITETISRIDLSQRPFRYWRESEEEQEPETCDALIIATGASAKRLNLPGEDTYWQSGISACAVCDGAVPIFR